MSSSGLTFQRTEGIYFKSRKKRCFEQPRLAPSWHRDPREKQMLQVKAFLAKPLNQNTPNTSARCGDGPESRDSRCQQPAGQRRGCRGPSERHKEVFQQSSGLGGKKAGQGLQERRAERGFSRGQRWGKRRGDGRHTCQGGLLHGGGWAETGLPGPRPEMTQTHPQEGASLFGAPGRGSGFLGRGVGQATLNAPPLPASCDGWGSILPLCGPRCASEQPPGPEGRSSERPSSAWSLPPPPCAEACGLSHRLSCTVCCAGILTLTFRDRVVRTPASPPHLRASSRAGRSRPRARRERRALTQPDRWVSQLLHPIRPPRSL